MTILAIDPGPKQSGVVAWYGLNESPIWDSWDKQDNFKVLRQLQIAHVAVCETIQSQGRGAVGNETFQTARWFGRFEQEASRLGVPFRGISRQAVAAHLYKTCPRPWPKTADARIRKALVARFGADAIRNTPGHALAALALAVTFVDQHPEKIVTHQEWAAGEVGKTLWKHDPKA